MARSLNQVTLMGNLTRDPELRQTPTGQNVTSFSLALNRSYKDSSGEWKEVTDYIDIVCWGPLAERVAQYMSKGRRCLVQGRLQSRSWEQEGQKRSKVEVLANDVTLRNLVPAELRGVGVRIEDDVLVTPDGARVLSAGLPRSADDVEAWLAAQREAGPRLPG